MCKLTLSKKIATIVLLFFVGNSLFAQTSDLFWAKRLGGIEEERGYSIAVDRSGNVYTRGYFNDTADFDPGPGIYNLISSGGNNNIFISKLNASGNFVWAKSMGGSVTDVGKSIATDENGNVYITGSFSGTVDFDLGPNTFNLTSTSYTDVFISKMDGSGNFVWAKRIGGTDGAGARSIVIDGSSNVYTTGNFSGTVDFDPGPGIYNLTHSAGSDVFVSKLDASGNFVWAKSIGESGSNSNSIAIDRSGNVYTTGWGARIFISKLDAFGNFVWKKSMGGTSGANSLSIAIDGSANIYTTGYFYGIADFDPGPNTFNLTSTNGYEDIFISKLDASGNFVWAKRIGGKGGDQARSIAVDETGSIYTTGYFTDTADFDPGPDVYNLTSNFLPKTFISKLDPSGNFIWAKHISSTYNISYSIAIDGNSNVYTTGMFIGNADFDPGPGTYYLTSSFFDIFVVKLKGGPAVTLQPKLYTSKALLSIGETQMISGKDFTTGGQVRLTIQNSNGDSVPVNTITYLPNGSFTYQLPITNSIPNGECQVYATDINTGKIANPVKFRVNNSLAITNILKITSPGVNTTSQINKPIKIEWADKPSHISAIVPNTSTVAAAYKIEYNRNNTGWRLIEIRTYPASYQQERSFPFEYTPTQTGIYQFRITDVLDGLNSGISATVTVYNGTANAIMDFVWDYSGNRPNQKPPIGVAADGTARIYIKVLKKAGNTKTISDVSISIKDSSNLSITVPRLLGKLMKATDTSSYSIEANNAASTTVSSNVSGAGNTFWFWYVAPDDFVRSSIDSFLSSRYLNLVATVAYSDNSTEPISAKVEIVRPPLMFVHGIGGSEKTWDNLQYKMNGSNRYFIKETDSRWKFRKALNMYPDGSYKQNAQLLLSLNSYGEVNSNVDFNESYKIQSFQYFLKQMRDKGYASNRVEYIAHSMGGVMARSAINYYSSEYKPNETVKRKFKNYRKGFINKLITLNTPHNGSPLADLTIEKLSQYSFVQKLLQNRYENSSFDFLIRSFFHTIGNTKELDFNNPTEALKNLRYGNNGIKLLTSKVKNHLISGDLLIGGEDCLDAYNIVRNDPDVELAAKLLAAIGGTSCIAIDRIFVPYGVPDFIENSDLVVPLSSELPGKSLSGSGSNYSIYYGTKPNHLSIYNSNKNPIVGQKVFELLNAPINSSNFADTIAPNNSAGTEIYRSAVISSISEYIDSNKIMIMQSLRDSIIAIDSSFTIPIKLKDTSNFKLLNLLFQDNIYTSTSRVEMQSFNVQVNTTSVNSQTIVATAIYDSSGTNIYYTDTLSVNVKADTVMNGFYVAPDTKILNSGQTYAPSYNLIHNTYISSISIVNTALHIAVADTNVVTYSISSGNFIAKDTGTTYAVISYKQFKDTLFIYISSPTDQNIIKACSQSNLSFFAGSNDSTKNYQWQVDAENGFEDINSSAVYIGTDSSTLTLNNVPTNWYNYKYRCIISDSIGSTTSEVFTLKFATTWIGNSDTAWENPANWSCAALPDSNTDVTISSTAPRFPQVNTNVSCRSLTVQHGAAVLVKTGYKIDIKGKDE